MKKIILLLVISTLFGCTKNINNRKSADTIVCEKALDSILNGEKHEIISVLKAQETTHLQWCLDKYTDLRLRQMLCADDFQIAKLKHNTQQMQTAQTNFRMYENDINKIIKEQDTATNNFVYEKIYEIIYKVNNEVQTLELTFTNNKLTF